MYAAIKILIVSVLLILLVEWILFMYFVNLEDEKNIIIRTNDGKNCSFRKVDL